MTGWHHPNLGREKFKEEGPRTCGFVALYSMGTRGRNEYFQWSLVFPDFLKGSTSINVNVLGQHFSLWGSIQTPNGVPCLRSLVLLKIWVNSNETKCNNQTNPIKILTSFCACYLLTSLHVSSDSSALPWRVKMSHLLSSESAKAPKKENICLFGVYERLEDLELPALAMGKTRLPYAQIVPSCTQRADPTGHMLSHSCSHTEALNMNTIKMWNAHRLFEASQRAVTATAIN